MKVKVRMVIGRGKHRPVRRKHGHFVSPSTNGVEVVAYAHSDIHHATPLATAVTNVSSGSGACTGSGGTRACTVLVTAPAGNDDFEFTLYDTAPSGGAIPAGANVLGLGAVTQTIVANTSNSISVSIGGLIAGLSGQAALVGIASTPQNVGLTIQPTDFGNNPIVAGSSNAPFANPIDVALTETGGTGHAALQLNGGTPAADVTASKASDTVQVVYDGLATPGYSASVTLTAPTISGQGATESTAVTPEFFVSNPSVFYQQGLNELDTYPQGQHVLAIGDPNAPGGTTFTATPTGCSGIARLGTIVGTNTASTLLIAGGVTTSTSGCSVALSDGTYEIDVPVTNQIRPFATPTILGSYTTTASAARGIATGADGNIWFDSQTDAVGGIGNAYSISTTGTNLTTYDMPNVTTPFGMTLGPDGNVWVGDDNSNKVTSITPAGVVTEYTAGNQWTNSVAAGLDGHTWFSICNAALIGDVNTQSGAVTNTTLAGGVSQGVTLGPDNNMWFTNWTTKHIETIVSGVPAVVGSASTNASWSITAGSDGALWFAEGNKIGQMTTGGTLTEFALPAGGSALPIIAGPDGALWFTDSSNKAIGRITTAGVLTEYPVGDTAMYALTVGPDGNLWVTGANKLYQMSF